MRSKADVVVFSKSGVNYQIQHAAGKTDPARLLRSKWPGFVFLACLSVVALRPYQHSLYDMDMLGYMGNAVAMSTVEPREIHAAVYQEIFTQVPNPARDHLLGRDNHILPEQINSPRDRSVDAYHFAEYLPCFAIRPLYNEVLYVLHKAGVGLVRSTILIAVVSYLGLGILVFLWLSRYLGQLYAAPFAFLLMISPS